MFVKSELESIKKHSTQLFLRDVTTKFDGPCLRSTTQIFQFFNIDIGLASGR